MKTCACIIPFYNEGARTLSLLEKIVHSKNISKFICVDDGSSDDTYRVIKKRFPKVQVIRNEKNLGKSAAILRGLQSIKSDYILLLDGDLSNIRTQEIDKAIKYISSDPYVDMIILRRKYDPWFSKVIRGEILASGERILRYNDLKNVYRDNPTGYQIEFAINFYMMKYKKSAYWVTFSGKNLPKIKKMGVVRGIAKELHMYRKMLDFGGYSNAIYSFLTFCTDEYKRPINRK